MLPFLKKKPAAAVGVIVKTRAPDQKPEENQDDKNDSSAAIEACAHDLITAVHARDVKGAAEAMQSAFEILETMPHDEIEHEETKGEE